MGMATQLIPDYRNPCKLQVKLQTKITLINCIFEWCTHANDTEPHKRTQQQDESVKSFEPAESFVFKFRLHNHFIIC